MEDTYKIETTQKDFDQAIKELRKKWDAIGGYEPNFNNGDKRDFYNK